MRKLEQRNKENFKDYFGKQSNNREKGGCWKAEMGGKNPNTQITKGDVET